MSICKHVRAALVLSLVALTGTAAAQDAPQPEPAPAPEPTTPTIIEPEPAPAPMATPSYQPSQPVYMEEEEPQGILGNYGISVSLGGSVEGFAGDTLSDATNVGGGWNVRVGVETPSPIEFEAAYIGSAQSIEALGLDNDALLVGNGLDAKIRVNLLEEAIQPFAYGGIGWRHYDISNADFNTSAVSDSDDVLELPLGVGVAYEYAGFLLDARGEFRVVTEEDLMPSQNTSDAADMHRWGINANVGYAF